MLGFIFPLVAIILIGYLLYKWSIQNYDYFEHVGIKYSKPLPLLGVNGFIIKGSKGISETILDLYNEFSTERVFGAFDFSKPIFVLRDLELVKQIAIKDFFHFQDHRTFVDPKTDDFFGNMLLAMKGKQWRDMRSSLSPLFTGSKMRLMFQLVIHCANELTNYVEMECDNNNDTFRMKDMFSRFTNDVIASCAFGVECNSLKNKDDEFFKIGQEFLSFQKSWQMIKLSVVRAAPGLANALGIQIFSPKVKAVFYNMIIETMRMRKEQGIKRPDMINWLMSLKEGDFSSVYDEHNATVEVEKELVNGEIKRNWTDTELIAQSFIFFLAGFETSSGVLQFLAYELAINQEIQTKLIQEIDETNSQLDGKPLTYDAMKSMTYMAMVINENMRKWPPGVVLDRVCVQDYTYEDDKGLKFKINEGDMIWIPAYGFHMDPKYFPNPQKFDPERFSEENKDSNNLDAFMPFGIGPRNCIGLRFALMEMKSMLYYLLLKFRIEVGKDTEVPIKLKNSIFGFVPKKEIKLKFTRRSDKKLN